MLYVADTKIFNSVAMLFAVEYLYFSNKKALPSYE
jgi:hypothetical protein